LSSNGIVTVYTYICLETVEERIEQILATKRELFAAIVDESDLPKTLTAREILGLWVWMTKRL
jgi:SNF2 family DNA or RNA helicase